MTAIPQRLLGEALLISTKKNPSKTAIIIREKEFSYSMLQAAAQNIAAHLINSGIKKGDRVAIYMNNSWESIVSIYGITLSGAVFLFINAQTKANKLQYILNDCGAKILIAESLLHADVCEALETAATVEQVIISGDTTRVISQTNVEVADFETILLHGNSK
jgi:acyl-CoA synthetase (AMP-forming)/AMP-acid ligase II